MDPTVLPFILSFVCLLAFSECFLFCVHVCLVSSTSLPPSLFLFLSESAGVFYKSHHLSLKEEGGVLSLSHACKNNALHFPSVGSSPALAVGLSPKKDHLFPTL